MKYLILILCVIMIMPVYGQRKGKEEVVVPTFTEGVVYSLPRTGVRFDEVGSLPPPAPRHT